MKGIIGFGVAVVVVLILFGIFGTIQQIKQNEIGFEYDVADGKPITPENNKLLSYGYHFAWGVDARFFVINSEINSYSFTMAKDKFSPNNEAMTWDSNEGATMSGDYEVKGRVTNPWKFFAFLGKAQRSISGIDGIQDEKIYLALRLAGRYAGVKMVELAQKDDAEEIMRNPKRYADELTKQCADYADTFGFTVTVIQFPKAFAFPGGKSITQAREMLSTVNSDKEKKKKEAKIAEQDKADKLAQAKIKAETIMAEGDREASELLSEAKALAEQLNTSIKQVGIEGTMQLKMAKLQGELMGLGVIPQAILTGDSIFGKPFYGKVGPKTSPAKQ